MLTLLTAAPKTFLGGVEIVGAVDERCTLAWFAGRTLSQVAGEAGACVGTLNGSRGAHAVTIAVGAGRPEHEGFLVALALGTDGFVVCPDDPAQTDPRAPAEVGVAAAGVALNEAFSYVYRRSPLAGQRRLAFRMPAVATCGLAHGKTVWLIGLGHLGQAFAWTLGLSSPRVQPALRLTDFDCVSTSSLSTCLLVKSSDIGRLKVQAVGERLAQLGFAVSLDAQRLNLVDSFSPVKADQAVVAVDNIALRRSLDRLTGMRIFEGGIGDGPGGFTRVQFHSFRVRAWHEMCGQERIRRRLERSISPPRHTRRC